MTDVAQVLTDIGAGRGSDPGYLVDEYLWHVKNAITNHPRSLQKAIGPSELGHSCERRIGYRLLGAPTFNTQPDVPWLPTIGTATHSWLEGVFAAPVACGRFLVEQRVTVGTVGGTEITGKVDLYDRATATVIDHKITGTSTLKSYRSRGPGQQYRSQTHCYGRGLIAEGLPVDRVMIAFLPRNDELKAAHFWSEPYDEQVALDALARAERIAAATSIAGPAALRGLPTADAYCHRCQFFNARATDPAIDGCLGDPNRRPDWQEPTPIRPFIPTSQPA